jgi:hypothetical protein
MPVQLRHLTMKSFAKAGGMSEGGQVYKAGCRWKKARMDPDVRQSTVPTVPSRAASGRVAEHPLPAHALLSRYGGDQGYADCYVATVPRRVTQAEYVEAFYTTRLFKRPRAHRPIRRRANSREPSVTALPRGRSRIGRPTSCCLPMRWAARGPGS